MVIRPAVLLILGPVLVLVGTLVAVVSYPRAPAPASVVAAYFAALQRADATAALQYAELPSADSRYLTDRVLTAQRAAGPISDVRIRAQRRIGSSAYVDIAYVVSPRGGRAAVVTGSVQLRERNRRWLVAQPGVAVTVRVRAAAQRATLAGLALPDGAVSLFPGVVPVRFDDGILTADPNTTQVGFADTPRTVTVTPRIAGPGKATVSHALRVAMAACLQSGAQAPPSCPLTPPGAVPHSLRGTLSAVSLTSVQVSGPAGLITVDATLTVRGTSKVLAFDNVAGTRGGRIVLGVTARFYGAAPGTVAWTLR